MTDPASGLSILHVIVRAGPTNSQFNEHCLPVSGTRRITVCSLLPADVTLPSSIRLVEGNGSVRGCFRAVRRALSVDTYDVVHVHAPASGIVVAATYLRLGRSRRDLVLTVHNSWQNFRLRNRLFLRFLLAFFPVVVPCGEAAHQSMPRRLRRRYARKLTIVRNGVDLARIDAVLASSHAPAPPEARPEGRTIVSVNRLIPMKNPAGVLAAFAASRAPLDRLVLVGDGPLRSTLDRQVRELGLEDHVELTGVIPRDDVYLRLRAADLFVSASRGEGLPVALLEAMATRCPVVVTDIPPHREVAALAPGVQLVDRRDAQALQRAVERLLALSQEQRSELGGQMRACVEDHFSVDAMNHAYGRIYARIARRVGPHELAPDAPLSERLHHRAGALALFTVLGALGGYAFAELQPPLYKGETTLMVGDAVSSVTDEQALRASAALAVTYADLARRQVVLGPVAAQGFADDWRELREEVHTQTGDKNPQLVQVSAYAGSAREAAELASAIGSQLVALSDTENATPRQRFIAVQLAGLRGELRTQQAALNEVNEALRTADPAAVGLLEARADELRRSLTELRGSYAELEQLHAPELADLRVVDSAWTARSPLRPTPSVLAVAGGALGFGLVVGWTHLFSRRRSTADPDESPDALSPGDIRPMRSETWAGAGHTRSRTITPREAHHR